LRKEGKTGVPGEKPLGAEDTLVGGERSRHRALPAPLLWWKGINIKTKTGSRTISNVSTNWHRHCTILREVVKTTILEQDPPNHKIVGGVCLHPRCLTPKDGVFIA